MTGETAIDKSNFILGRKEWVTLPHLGLSAIKAKIDTGARTSALHARDIEPFGAGVGMRVRFIVHPIPLKPSLAVVCDAPVKDLREIMSSSGVRERRYIIETAILIGGREWMIELGLTNREAMTHRMLIGRQALPADALVDPAAAYVHARLSAAAYTTAKSRKR